MTTDHSPFTEMLNAEHVTERLRKYGFTLTPGTSQLVALPEGTLRMTVAANGIAWLTEVETV